MKERFPMLDQDILYLDAAATTPVLDSVIKASNDYYRKYSATVHRSFYDIASKSEQLYEETRLFLADYLNAEGDIIFTKGTTEAINLVAFSYGETLSPGDEIVLSIAEHHSNIVPWQELAKRRSLILRFVPLNANLELDMAKLEEFITPKCKLVALAHIYNTTGACNDVKKITEIAHRNGSLILIDGAQALANIPIDLKDLGVDFYALSAHKAYGPSGLGALYIRQGLSDIMLPYQTGGAMVATVSLTETRFAKKHQKFEAGTPMIAQVIAWKAALIYLQSLPWEKIKTFKKELFATWKKNLSSIEGISIINRAVTTNSTIILFNIAGYHHFDIAHMLNDYKVCLRSGHHCAEPFFASLKLTGALRISLGIYNSKAESLLAKDALLDVIQQLRLAV